MSSSLSKAEIKKYVLGEIETQKREGIQFAIAGNSGYGKTSTLNRLFSVDMKTDAVQPATEQVHELSLLVQGVSDIQLAGKIIHDVHLTVFDLPGLGDGEEYTEASQRYFEIYTQLLPQVDVVFWVLRADVKAFELDIHYISRLLHHSPELSSRIIIGLNFIDSISPQNWDVYLNNISIEQESNLNRFQQRVDKLIHQQCGIKSGITVPYSAKYAWGLETLFNRLIQAVSEQKRWIFADLKPNYREAFLQHVHPKFREQVAKEYVLA